MTTLLTALACAVLAAALTRWVRTVAGSDSRWLRSGVHVVLAALGGAGAAAIADDPAELVAFGALAVGFAVLVVIDLAVHRLPDIIVGPMYPVLFAALAVSAAGAGDWGDLGRAAAGAAALFVLYFALAFINPAGLGLGDVKLSGLLGAWLGWLGWPYVLYGTLFAFLINGTVALIVVVTTRAGRHSEIPFGPAMILGAVLGAWASTGPFALG